VRCSVAQVKSVKNGFRDRPGFSLTSFNGFPHGTNRAYFNILARCHVAANHKLGLKALNKVGVEGCLDMELSTTVFGRPKGTTPKGLFVMLFDLFDNFIDKEVVFFPVRLPLKYMRKAAKYIVDFGKAAGCYTADKGRQPSFDQRVVVANALNCMGQGCSNLYRALLKTVYHGVSFQFVGLNLLRLTGYQHKDVGFFYKRARALDEDTKEVRALFFLTPPQCASYNYVLSLLFVLLFSFLKPRPK